MQSAGRVIEGVGDRSGGVEAVEADPDVQARNKFLEGGDAAGHPDGRYDVTRSRAFADHRPVPLAAFAWVVNDGETMPFEYGEIAKDCAVPRSSPGGDYSYRISLHF